MSEDSLSSGHHRYRLVTLCSGALTSIKCEVCELSAASLFYQEEQRYCRYRSPGGSILGSCWSNFGCVCFIGDLDCLVRNRRGRFLRTVIDREGVLFHLYSPVLSCVHGD